MKMKYSYESLVMLNLKSHSANQAIVSSLAWSAIKDILTKVGK